MSGATLWVVWGLIGLIAGYMSGRMMVGGRVALLVIFGIIGGVIGGWLLTDIFGTGDKICYASLITAACGAAVVVWVGMVICRKWFPVDPDDMD